MSEMIEVDPQALATEIRPLTPQQALHMLDSMTWFPRDEGDRWSQIAAYVGDRAPGDRAQPPDIFRSVYRRLVDRFALVDDDADRRTGRWAAIPSPKGLYQLKYAIKTLMLPDAWFNCMNMGYSKPGEPGWINPPPGREIMQFSLQLYDHVAQGAPLAGRDVLEIGAGRGGGAIFLSRRYAPASYTAVDLCDRNVAFSQAGEGAEAVRFLQGDAESLPFDDAGFDVAINIESAHCYPRVERFLGEVMRVLRPGGRFLFADEWWRSTHGELREKIAGAGFEMLREEDITANIIAALEELKLLFPRFLDRCAQTPDLATWRTFFAERVCRDSAESYTSGRFGFFNYVLRKPDSAR